MASIGLRKPYVAIYEATGNTVTYTDGKKIAKAIEHNLELEDTDPVILYADDGPAEAVGGFAGGTLTLNVDSLPIEMAAMIYGITAQTLTEPAAGSEIDFDDDTNPPYLGYGVIVPKIRNNARIWAGLVLTKVKFNETGDAFTTKGEQVEFATPELTATVMRDDTAKHAWRKYAEFGTEEAAESWVKGRLGISA